MGGDPQEMGLNSRSRSSVRRVPPDAPGRSVPHLLEVPCDPVHGLFLHGAPVGLPVHEEGLGDHHPGAHPLELDTLRPLLLSTPLGAALFQHSPRREGATVVRGRLKTRELKV